MTAALRVVHIISTGSLAGTEQYLLQLLDQASPQVQAWVCCPAWKDFTCASDWYCAMRLPRPNEAVTWAPFPDDPMDASGR